MNGITAAAGTLSYWLRRQEITAANLAHVGGTAYKAVHGTGHATESGAPVAAEWTDLTQGALKETGRPFDLAIDGKGFLVVDTPRGERLTRGGSFELDPGGRLTDPAGHALLSAEGPIVVTGNSFQVNADGSVLVDGEKVGQLRVENAADPATLAREEGDLFHAAGGTTPIAPTDVKVLQGQLETANVDPVMSMVDMIAIQRSYAANVQTLKTLDHLLDVAAGQVGDTE